MSVNLGFMSTYTKLWSQLIDSTVWQHPNDFRVLWITILAKKDRDHVVRASIPGLARLANITPQQCEEYLHAMMSPDPYSTTKDYEGRRLLPLEGGGGWLVINGAKYQDYLREEHRREAVKAAVARHRARKKNGSRA